MLPITRELRFMFVARLDDALDWHSFEAARH